MSDTLKPGTKISWKSAHGTVEGTVERTLTHEAHVKGHTAKASPEHPEVLVKSDKTGAEAIHKPESLKRR